MDFPKPRFSRTINLGEVIAVVGALSAGIYSYATLQSNQAATDQKIAVLQATLKENQETFKAMIASTQNDMKAWQDNRDRAYTERRSATDSRFAAIDTKLAPMDAILFRLGKQEADNAAVGQRIDRVVNAFSDKLDALQGNINSVGTKVDVLTERISEQTGRRSSGGMAKPQP